MSAPRNVTIRDFLSHFVTVTPVTQFFLWVVVVSDPKMPFGVTVIYSVIFAAWWLSELIKQEAPKGIPFNDNGRIGYIEVTKGGE